MEMNEKDLMFIALCTAIGRSNYQIYSSEIHHTDVWRSVRNSDGELLDGNFLLGIGRKISVSLPIQQYWGICQDISRNIEKSPKMIEYNSNDRINMFLHIYRDPADDGL